MPSDIVARLRAWVLCYRSDSDVAVDMAASADEIERLSQHVRALEIEIERYRIQCVRISDLERMLEVQDTQLEHAQRALRILEGRKHEQQG
jgi:hypothetical protein